MVSQRVINILGMVILLAGGFLLVAFLALEALGLAGSQVIYSLPGVMMLYLIAKNLGFPAALILAGLLIYLALNELYVEGRHRKAFYITLATMLLLGVGALILRHGILVKTISRAPEDHFPFLGVFLALIIGILLLQTNRGRKRWSGASYLLFVPALIILAFGLGLRIDPHAITDARAMQIDQAIERYRHEFGSYPLDLADLTPGYLPILLGPLTGSGQIWCYQAGEDYYRLGYVLFERYHQYDDGTPFWEPYYEIKISGSAGQLPAGTGVCDNELERMKRYGGLVNLRIWIDYVRLNGQGG